MSNLIDFCLKNSNMKLDNIDNIYFIDSLLNNNMVAVGIYNFPELTLIKSNQIYMDILNNSSIKIKKDSEFKLKEIKEIGTDNILIDILKKSIETQEMQCSEYIYFHNINGSSEYLKCIVNPIIKNNTIKYLTIIFINVTKDVLNNTRMEKEIEKLKKEKEKLQEENSKYKNIIDNISDGIFLSNKEGKIEYLNKAARNFIYNDNINYIGETLAHTNYYDLEGNKISLTDLPSSKSLQGETILSMRLIVERPDITIKTDISSNPIYDKENNIIGSVASIRCLNDSLKVEKCLKKQRDDFYNIIDNLDLLICRFSYPDFNIIHYNQKVKEEILDINKCSDNLFMQIPYNDRQKIDKIKSQKTMISGSTIKTLINKKERYIETFYQLIYDNNKIREVVKVGIDITDKIGYQKELETILKTQEEFFSFIAHEFRTPLTVMSSTTQLINLLYKKDLPEKVQNYIDKINLSILQQLRLVNNLLDITKAGSGYLNINLRNYDIVSMSRLITESVMSFAIRKNINLEFKCDFDEKVIAIDDEKYERILLNLLSNALKFTKNGNKVIVKVGYECEFISIDVKDEGVGIPKEKQKVIFDRFGQVNNDLTRKSEGTGIGLCLVKLLVNAIGGKIELTSYEGVGSNFRILLPDKKVLEETKVVDMNLMDNRLIQTMDIEFSNIYLE